MNRICFTLRVDRAALAKYKTLHENVWPEMLDALTHHGWHNYSLFLADDGLLIGYFETPGTLEQAVAAMEAEPVNARWQELMAPLFIPDGTADHPDQMMRSVAQIFYLE